MSDSDVEKNKAMAIIGYIVPILFFIPLVTDGKNSPFAKFHANQQLLLFICYIAIGIAINILFGIIRLYLIFSLGHLCSLGLFVLAIVWAISASRGEMKPLPVIGGIEIIK
ncbi:MAG: hypothetical protein FWF95_01635 [Syntrophorhabdaceae bacterium]|nr:hypothetical protein [Syntrophorhabdaceae bacterium]